MSYLIDTNVLSELRRKSPNPAVVEWFEQRPPTTLYLSVLTLGEIRKGIESISDTSRKQALSDWLQTDLTMFFTGRILEVDAATADHWGRLVAQAGCPLPAIDSLLAATASRHGMTLVTRNVKDVAGMAVEVFNPWDS